jgi:hypothetical protein
MELAIVHRKGTIVGMFMFDSWRHELPYDYAAMYERGLQISSWPISGIHTIEQNVADFHLIQGAFERNAKEFAAK